jgi:hypothetical protein
MDSSIYRFPIKEGLVQFHVYSLFPSMNVGSTLGERERCVCMSASHQFGQSSAVDPRLSVE